MEKADAASSAIPLRIPYWRFIFDQTLITPEIQSWQYDGAGTDDDPYVVTWISNDPRNPHNISTPYKWFLTMLLALTTLAASLISSSYTGCLPQIDQHFHVSDEVATLGLSLYVLGFAVGPILWAPLSEMYGRQLILFITYGALTAFNGGATAAQNIQTLVIVRFFAGTFGASPLTNSGAVIADLFTASERGLAMSIFATAPFLGPSLGPMIGGFLGQAAGWRWVMGLGTIFTGVIWIFCALVIPETYAPLLLRKRADRLSKMTGKVYRTRQEILRGRPSARAQLKTALSRPWILMVREPIVLLLSLLMSIVYGILYLFFGAFPIVYQEKRGWNEGQGGLAFLGIAVGMILAVGYSIIENKRYGKLSLEGKARPEDRLVCAVVGGVAIPISLFWFGWTNSPSISWWASVSSGVVFGFGMVLIFISIKNYLVDAYTVYSASVLAATVIMRSAFGAAFPLFTTYMYHGLGIHWATMIPAFFALACAPLPVLFYIYGEAIRKRCKYAALAEQYLKSMAENERKLEERQKKGQA